MLVAATLWRGASARHHGATQMPPRTLPQHSAAPEIVGFVF